MVLENPLRILHVLRAPMGGLFRHVRDLAQAQAERGHLVGVMADSTHASPEAEATFQELAKVCKLGVFRVPMSRQLGLKDRKAVRHVTMRAEECKAEILHGHGAESSAGAGREAGLVLGTVLLEGRELLLHLGEVLLGRGDTLGAFALGA